MKPRGWLFWTIALVVVILLINVLYTSVSDTADLHVWTLFGYKFGFNWTSHPIPKVIIVVGGYIALHMLDQKQFEDELKQ